MLQIAIRFILFDKPKSLGALLGIIISVFLIGQQSGILIFLTNAMSKLVDNTPTGIWVVDSKTTNVNALGLMDNRVVREVESIPGVLKAYPLVITNGSAKFENGQSSGVTLIGSQPPNFRGGPFRIVQGDKLALINEGAVSTDVFDSKNLGNVQLGNTFEIAGKRVKVAVQTAGARGFGAVYVFTSIDRARALARVSSNKVSALLVDLQPGADTLQVRDMINAKIYGVKAWTPRDFSKATVTTVLSTSGITFGIGTLIVFAVISGMVIIGLTLYSAAVDRIRDYGTLKAIGATNGFVSRLILIQAVIFSIIGYAIAYVLLEGFRVGIAKAGTFFDYSLTLRIAFFAVTLLIALCGAIFAIRRINQLEPAAVFR